MTPRLSIPALVALVAASSHALVAEQTPAPMLPAMLTNNPQIAELWEPPTALAERDLYNGPWGVENAPDPNAVYTFIAPAKGGNDPGMIVRDPRGREWEVRPRRTPPSDREGAIEVVLSRVLAAIGFHQPPVYFLPAFHVVRDATMRTEPGGVLRLQADSLKALGEWSWRANPYANTRPLRGLLVMLLMFDSADLGDANNTIYQYTAPDGAVRRWFVVRDLGTARPARPGGNPDTFEHTGFIERVENGFVEFAYDGPHQDLVTNRITPSDVRWASYLLSRLTPKQWHDAFRAGGYLPAPCEHFIRRLHETIGDGLALGETTVR